MPYLTCDSAVVHTLIGQFRPEFYPTSVATARFRHTAARTVIGWLIWARFRVSRQDLAIDQLINLYSHLQRWAVPTPLRQNHSMATLQCVRLVCEDLLKLFARDVGLATSKMSCNNACSVSRRRNYKASTQMQVHYGDCTGYRALDMLGCRRWQATRRTGRCSARCQTLIRPLPCCFRAVPETMEADDFVLEDNVPVTRLETCHV